jgi:hypothetical protein
MNVKLVIEKFGKKEAYLETDSGERIENLYVSDYTFCPLGHGFWNSNYDVSIQHKRLEVECRSCTYMDYAKFLAEGCVGKE